MAKPNENHFLRLAHSLWRDAPGGYVEMRAIPAGKDTALKPRREFVNTAEDALSFIDKHSARTSQYGVYYGVCKRRDSGGGRKDNILSVPALWADIDTLKAGADTNRVLRILDDMPGLLRPSVAILTGGGIHAMWLLDKASTDFKAVEGANRVLEVVVGGDAVSDVTRILRCPASWNTKRTKKVLCEVAWCRDYDRHSLEDIKAAASGAKLWIDGDKLAPAREIVKREVKSNSEQAIEGRLQAMMSRGNRNSAKVLNEMWQDRVRYRPGEEGAPRGYIGIHEAQLLTTARLAAAEIAVEGIVNDVMRRTKEAVGRAGGEWDWEKERQTVKAMTETWLPKWKEIKARERAEAREKAKQEKLISGKKA